jgi:hypothetical protein
MNIISKIWFQVYIKSILLKTLKNDIWMKFGFRAVFSSVFKITKGFLFTYLCGTSTNIWLRPDQEDLSMTVCLEHSASNLWRLGPGYCCSPHPPNWISVFLDFSFQWGWLWIEFFVVGLRVFWSCDQRSAICLSSWHLGHRAVELFIEFVVVPSPVDTIFDVSPKKKWISQLYMKKN